jgi:hypothetical protein
MKDPTRESFSFFVTDCDQLVNSPIERVIF